MNYRFHFHKLSHYEILFSQFVFIRSKHIREHFSCKHTYWRKLKFPRIYSNYGFAQHKISHNFHCIFEGKHKKKTWKDMSQFKTPLKLATKYGFVLYLKFTTAMLDVWNLVRQCLLLIVLLYCSEIFDYKHTTWFLKLTNIFLSTSTLTLHYKTSVWTHLNLHLSHSL